MQHDLTPTSPRNYRFTVLTPTFNRAHLISGTYQSLCSQTFHDFQWLVVDDGSTDGTDELVLGWREKADFPIEYFWQPNGGMHAALNTGICLAAGEYVIQFDSDDRCIPTALERFDYWIKQLPDQDKFCAVVSLAYQRDGVTLLGSPFPADHIDTFRLRDALALCKVDRWGAQRTAVARQFPYPQFANETYLAPGVVQNRMVSKYAVRFFNEALLIAGYASGGLSSRNPRWTSPKGAMLYSWEVLFYDVPWRTRLKAIANLVRFSPALIAKLCHLI